MKYYYLGFKAKRVNYFKFGYNYYFGRNIMEHQHIIIYAC